MESKNTDTIEKIKKAKFQIQIEEPFFAYFSLFLKMRETEEIPTMGVNLKGDLFYNDKFVNSLSNEELKGVVYHEIFHLVMRHLTRLGSRNFKAFNYACDLSINHLISDLNLNSSSKSCGLPKCALLPDYKDEFNFNGYIIQNVSKKFAEELYDELEREWKKKKQEKQDKKDKKDKKGNKNKQNKKDKWDTNTFGEMFGDYKFDEHMFDNLSSKEKEDLEKVWSDRLIEASTLAKMAGKLPRGVERLLDKVNQSKIDWKSALNKYVSNLIPYTFCYSKPSKRSKSVGSYLPHLKKESIEIGVMVDLSGSVGNEEYSQFMGEVIGIARAYRERLKIHFFSHDAEGYYNGVVDNGNIEKIKQIKLKGGGGTCFNEPSKFITEKNKNLKAIVWLTDGYGTEIESKPNYDILWVIEKNGTDDICKKYGRVIRL